MSVGVIACLTIREASRRWVLWVALFLGLAFLAVYAVGYHEIYRDMQRQSARMSPVVIAEMENFFLLAGLYVVNFLTLIMTVLTSVDTLSGEIASGTIHTLVSKPMHRWEIVIGKWLGFAGMLSAYLILMAGGVMFVVFFISGYEAPNAGRGLLLMLLNILVLLSVTFFGGSMLSTLANGVLAFGAYGIAFIGGWIEQFGGFLQNQAAVNIGIVCSLLIPSEAIWRRAAYEMRSPLSGVLGFSPFSSTSVPSPLMIGYAVGYTLLMMALTLRQFARRDL